MMKDIKSIVPLLPVQQQMLTATLKNGQDLYVQQLLFEISNYSENQVSTAINKLVETYECLRSLILFEGLKQPVLVCKNDVYPKFDTHTIEENYIDTFINEIKTKGFDFQKEPCLRFDWINSNNKKLLCITNHHILFDGWGKQVILGDFIKILKFPNIYIAEKQNKIWYDAWFNLDHPKAIQSYKKYLLKFDDFASISQISSLKQENLEYKTQMSHENFEGIRKILALTGAEFINFSWSIFISIWTQNNQVQFGVIKQNGLIGEVKNGFGIGIQTLPFQFKIDFQKSIIDHLEAFKEREREIAGYSYVNNTDSIFSQFNYEFLIAFENYPLESTLETVENEFKLISSFDRSEFPLSLAVTPYSNRFDFDWHFNTKYHCKEQITFLVDQFHLFLEEFNINKDITLKEISNKWFKKNNEIISFKHSYNKKEFLNKLVDNLSTDQLEFYNKISNSFQKSINRIWIYGDKHHLMLPLITAAWNYEIEVLTVNEKESKIFLDKLLEIKKPDLIFTSIDDNRFSDVIFLNQSFTDLKYDNSTVKKPSEIALSVCTSGSTGDPKVVQLSLENLISFFQSWDENMPWREKEYFASIAHPAFDIGVAELMFPLWKNWNIKLIDKSMLSNPKLLGQEIAEVTAFHMVPALLDSWIETAESDNKYRIIMTGGDKVPPNLNNKLKNKFPKTKLFQFYGPSECSVLASYFENKGQFENNLYPIGRPFNNSSVLIFGKENLPIGAYQEGEIIVLGPSVGIGYANFDNTEKFFNFKNTKAYKTGDFGFKDNLGNLFFRGRKDNQIKINGQRIELSRIESSLKEWSAIDNWIVVPFEKMFFAFAKSKQNSLPNKEHLKDWLPYYAIPQQITLISEFPLNKNGKVDNKQLIQLALSEIENNQHTEIINHELENTIIELFKDKLLNFSIGWYANGLNSIDALKLSGIAKNKLKISLDINQILAAENIFKICQSTSVNDILKNDIKIIEVGQKIYSTASRILFLSESDEQFFKSYWISSGVKLPLDFNVEKIKKWIYDQQNLHLAVEINNSEYFWKRGEIKIIDIDIKSENDFIQEVEKTFFELTTSLFIVFIGKSKSQNYLAFKVHHSLIDGIGLEQLWEKLYDDIYNHNSSTIKLITPNEEKIDTLFWEKYLQNIEVTSLPFERSTSDLNVAKRINIDLSIEERQILTDLSTNYKCSLFEAGLVLFTKMMHQFKSTNQAIGIPVNTGEFVDSNHISAMSVNILPFITEHSSIKEIIENWRIIFDKRFTPFSEIAQLDKNQKNGTPFFNSTYLYHSQKNDKKNFEPINFNRSTTDFNLALDFIEEKEKFVFSWEYRADLFSETAIRKLHNMIFNGLEKLSSKSYKLSLNLKTRWKKIVDSFPDKPAIIFKNQTVTFSELHKSITHIKENHQLSNKIEVLILDRNIESISKLLFHLIEGIPFIPIDSENTIDRINQISQISTHINTSLNEFSELQYVIATSGTTGVPKLVGIKKSGYESAITAWIEDYEMNINDCCLQAASFSFDVSLGDIGRSFFNGCSLILLDSSERKDPSLILEKINQYSVTVFETTPLIIRWWLNDQIELKAYPSLRLLIVGSDSWKMKELRKLQKTKSSNQRIISSYGLSETTIDNSFFDPDTDDKTEYTDEMIVPIGKSMNHCELSICDSNGKQNADGIEGFITITGPAVGLGYFIDGEWTNTENNIWLSKDKGICDEWGNYHFNGRSDRQVKIRGQRIELEEIERIITSLSPNLNWYIVDFEHELSTEMAAFYVGELTLDEINSLKSKLILKFPSYYLPSLFVKLNKFPLNNNGKIDSIELRKTAIKNNSISLHNESELELISKLTFHFNECFNQKINAQDNFFQFGKNSFDAMHFVRSWNKIYEEKMAVHQLFSSKNMESLSQTLSIKKKITGSKNPIKKISKAQEAIWFEIKNGNSSLFNLPHFIEIQDYDIEKIKTAFENTLKSCTSLFSRFEETASGDVLIQHINSDGYKIQIIEIENLENFKKKAFNKEFDFLNGLPFEAAILKSQDKNVIYFNPHHLVYDGGSDSYLSKLFFNFYDNKELQEEQSNEASYYEPISWSDYFKLSTLPEIHFKKSNTELQPTLILVCDEIQRLKIKQLTIDYNCTQTTIISHLLSLALHSLGININWISIALDHRTVDAVGMYMRAYPFPAYNSKIDTDENIARQKWALSQLFAASEQNIIYPEYSAIEAFHQVGLVIQHPFNVDSLKMEDEKIEFARPRLPLSLYVEEINEHLFFRWEFDNNQIQIEKIKQLHYSFFDFADKLILKKKKILNYQPDIHAKFENKSIDIIESELMRIWTKFVDNSRDCSHFFEAGGNSIKALLMLKEIENSLSIKISPSDFFKQPTIRFLNLSISKSDNKSLIWELKQGNEGEEIWLFPPIMGYGLIFNSLNLPNKKVIAFNYPMTMGIDGVNRIEEIALELIKERQNLCKLPKEVTILGYSMGGLTAFEVAKWLENNDVKVKKLIILDKTAQPEPGNIIKRLNLKSELVEIANQISSNKDDLARMINYLKSHEQMIEEYQQNGILDCEIDVFYCEEGFDEIDFLKWKLYTNKKVNFKKIKKISHYEIPKIWNNLDLSF